MLSFINILITLYASQTLHFIDITACNESTPTVIQIKKKKCNMISLDRVKSTDVKLSLT